MEGHRAARRVRTARRGNAGSPGRSEPRKTTIGATARGTVNADKLRLEGDVTSFVADYFEAGKPVGVICHGPWTLVEADMVRGRTLTSWPSLRTDIRNAGGEWVDKEVVVDEGLVTSRKPDDLPAFCAKIVEEFAECAHDLASAAATGGS